MKYIVIKLILLLFSNFVYAEPNSTAIYLMNQPVSLFDIGQMNIRKDLKERNFQVNDCKQSYSNINFNWEHSEFILFLRFNCSVEDIKLLKTNCKTAIGDVRGFFGVDRKTGKKIGPTTNVSASHFSTRFRHLGYLDPNEPKDIYQNIDHMLRIKVFMDKIEIIGDQISGQGIVQCDGRLLSTSVLFED